MALGGRRSGVARRSETVSLTGTLALLVASAGLVAGAAAVEAAAAAGGSLALLVMLERCCWGSATGGGCDGCEMAVEVAVGAMEALRGMELDELEPAITSEEGISGDATRFSGVAVGVCNRRCRCESRSSFICM